MSRTQGRQDCDTGYGDGQFFFSSLDGNLTTGAGTPTRIANGDFGLLLAAGTTAVLEIPLTSLLLRYGVQDYLFEQFGSARAGGAIGAPVGGYTTLTTAQVVAGINVSIPVLNSAGFTAGRRLTLSTGNTIEYPTIVSFPDATHILVNQVINTHAANSVVAENLFTTPAGVSGPAGYTGESQFNQPTSARPKGILIKQIYLAYLVTGAALTLNTVTLTKRVSANGVANVITTLIAAGANGLQTAVQATPYLTPIQVPVLNQGYLTQKFTSLSLEWDVTTAGGGTAELYGIFVDVAFNHN